MGGMERWVIVGCRGEECEKNGGVVMLCFFFNDTATTEIYTLSLHDALPISKSEHFDVNKLLSPPSAKSVAPRRRLVPVDSSEGDRKSTRLNSSHPSRSRMPSSA